MDVYLMHAPNGVVVNLCALSWGRDRHRTEGRPVCLSAGFSSHRAVYSGCLACNSAAHAACS
eukprot:6128787-Amphidinium_carterae.1